MRFDSVQQKLTKLYFKLKPLFSNKKILIISFLVSLGLLLPKISQAGVAGVGKLLGGIFYIIGWFMYKLAVGLFGPILGWAVEGTQGFMQNEVVTEGWSVVRDTANMFFILILLFIAFATILRIEAYTYRRMLVPMIIAILLVNFSRTICGIVVDFSDTLMRGFIGGLGGEAENIAPALLHASNMDTLLTVSWEKLRELETEWSEVVAIMFTTAYITVFTISIIAVSIFLIIRTLALAFLTIASPLVFAFQVIPAAKTFTGKWWPAFIKYALYGPVAVFCIMLAAKLSGVAEKWIEIDPDTEQFVSATSTPTKVLEGLFVMGILFASVKAAQTLGVAGAGAITKFAKSAGTFAPRQAAKWLGGALAAGRAGAPGRGLIAMGRFFGPKGKGAAIGAPFRKMAPAVRKVVTPLQKAVGRFQQALGKDQAGVMKDTVERDKELSSEELKGRVRGDIDRGAPWGRTLAHMSLLQRQDPEALRKEVTANPVLRKLTPSLDKRWSAASDEEKKKIETKGASDAEYQEFMGSTFKDKAPFAMDKLGQVSRKNKDLSLAHMTKHDPKTNTWRPLSSEERGDEMINTLKSSDFAGKKMSNVSSQVFLDVDLVTKIHKDKDLENQIRQYGNTAAKTQYRTTLEAPPPAIPMPAPPEEPKKSKP